MSVEGGAQRPAAVPPLPSSIWVVAWASLAGQAVLLAWQGVRPDDEVSLVLSVVLGALLVGYVSAGVVRARTVRLAFAWVVLVLSLIAELVGLVSALARPPWSRYRSRPRPWRWLGWRGSAALSGTPGSA